MKLEDPDRGFMLLWAIECAERVLPLFEGKYPGDDRPRRAIEAPREWLRRGEVSMGEVRAVSLAAHAAAHDAIDSPAACAAARAAGQAAGAAHVSTHAAGAASYAAKAAGLAATDAQAAAVTEHEWQLERLPERLRSIGFPVRKRRVRTAK